MSAKKTKKTKTAATAPIRKVDLSVKLGPLRLKNPVMTASGTFGTGEEYAEFVDLNSLGAVVTKTVTLEERIGNPPPRTIETPAGLLNAIGLQNVGLRRFLDEKMPFLAGLKAPVIVNIAGNSAEEYARVARELTKAGGIAAIEMNISCPNVKRGGVSIGVDPELAAEATRKCRRATDLPLIVKLTPNVTDMLPIARAVVKAGADILSMVNTFRGMAIDIRLRRPALGNVIGGLSGPAIKPLALHHVYRISSEMRIPIIGMGGIRAAEDAVEFMMAGATAVSVGTANFINPAAAPRVIEGLEGWCRKEGVERLRDIIGAALPKEQK